MEPQCVKAWGAVNTVLYCWVKSDTSSDTSLILVIMMRCLLFQMPVSEWTVQEKPT